MAEFLGYGILILVGLLFGLMLWRHARGHGTGCCGEHDDCGHKREFEMVKKDDRTGQQSRPCH